MFEKKKQAADKPNLQKEPASTNEAPARGYAYGILEFMWNRIPNFQEALTSASVTSIIELALGNVMEHFGDNPTAKNVIRDLTKVPSNILLVYNGNTVGGTGFKYDQGHLYGSIIKAGCKLTILSTFSAAAFYNPTLLVHFPETARVSNYVCEVPARFLVLMGQKKQTANATDVPYLQFLRDNWQYQDILDATFEAIFKTFTTDFLGQQIKKLRLEHVQKVLANGAINAYIRDLTGDTSYSTSHKFSLWEELSHSIKFISDPQMRKTFTPNEGEVIMPTLFPCILDPISCIKAIVVTASTKYIFHNLKSIIDAYLLAPPARLVQDATGLLLEHLIKLKEEFTHNGDLSTSQTHSSLNEICTQDMKEAEEQQYQIGMCFINQTSPYSTETYLIGQEVETQ